MITAEKASEADIREFQKERAALLERGYKVVEEWKGLTPGVRVRHRGQQYIEAFRDGTATVLEVYHNHGSFWEREWHQCDVELLVLRDNPILKGMGRIGGWANYHTALIDG